MGKKRPRQEAGGPGPSTGSSSGEQIPAHNVHKRGKQKDAGPKARKPGGGGGGGGASKTRGGMAGGKTAKAGTDKRLEDMDADEFMRWTPSAAGKLSALTAMPKEAQEEGDDDDDDDDDDDIDDIDAALATSSDDEEGQEEEGEQESQSEDNSESESEEGEEGDDDDSPEAHAKVLGDLASKDPEFFKYLQAEEPGLLQFDPTEFEGDEEGEQDGGAGGKGSSGPQELTSEVLKGLFEAAFQRRSLTGLRRLLQAFRSGCHMGDEDEGGGADDFEGGDEEGGRGGGGAKNRKYRISTSEIYNDLMVGSLKNLHKAFSHHLFPKQRLMALKEATRAAGVVRTAVGDTPDTAVGDTGEGGKAGGNKNNSAAKAKAAKLRKGKASTVKVNPVLSLSKADFKAVSKRPVWRAVQPMLYGFFKALLHVMGQLRDKALLAFVLESLQHYVPLLVPFSRVGRLYLKALLAVWGSATAWDSEDGEDEAVVELPRNQALAFLRIREMAIALPFPFIEDCLKGVYLSYVRNAKFASEQTLPKITFLGNCVVQLYGLDIPSSYQQGCVYIRQLALHLRQAITKGNQELQQNLLRWQFFNCLKLWTAVLAAYPAEEDLRMLVYPLAQVITGVISLMPVVRFSPMRLHCVALLQQLACCTGEFVPVSSLLLDVLEALGSKAPSPSTAAAPVLQYLLKLNKQEEAARSTQDALVSEVVRLLQVEASLYKYSAAFPELCIPLVTRLKRFIKQCRVSKWRVMIRGVIDGMEGQARWVAQRRLVLLGPTAGGGGGGGGAARVMGLEVLAPPGAPSMGERLSQSGRAGAGGGFGEGGASTEASITAATAVGGGGCPNQTKKGSKDSNKSSKKKGQQKREEEEGNKGSKAKAKATSSGKKKVNKAAAAAAAAATAEEMSADAPDLVEQFDGWSDED